MAIVHEGTSYGVHWTIDDQGLLYIDSGVINCTDINPTWGWSDYSAQIQSVESGNMSWQEGANAINMFRGCTHLISLDLSNFDTSNVTNMSYMFSDCESLTSLDSSNFDTSNVTDMSYMFHDCNNLISLDLLDFDTSYVINMGGMFSSCYKLTSLDLLSFDTSNVTNMSYMFSYCNNLTSLDLSSFNTSNVTDMSFMFRNCNNLIFLDLSDFNTSNILNMSSMFYNCNNLTSLDLSSFNTSSVISMSYMFHDCNNLISLNLSNFNTSNVTDMSYMFWNCFKLISLDLLNFDTNNVSNMRNMFSFCRSLTSLNLSNFDTSNVTNMSYMFNYCNNLTSLNLSSFDISNVTSMEYMFGNCSKLSCNFYINNIPTNAQNIFINTVEPIYIIYNVSSYESSDPIAVFWREIASQYQNVHFEADDHKEFPPLISGEVIRIDENTLKQSSEGTKVNITIDASTNNNLVPQNITGPAANRLAQFLNITIGIDGDNPISGIVGNNIIDLTQQLKLPEDSHTFICTAIDINTSSVIVLELTQIQALLDFLGKGSRDKYVDKPGMGMSIGKLATRNGLDIEFPTTIGKELLPAVEYNLTTDTEVVDKRDYYEYDSESGTYDLVTPQEDDNPVENGWYNSSIDLNKYQLVVGKYNKRNDDAMFIVGNGTESNRSNLMEIGDIITIGETNQSRIEIDYHSMQLIDKDDNSYFYVSDLRNEDGELEITQSFTGDGYTAGFSLSAPSKDINYSVKLNDVEVTNNIIKDTLYFRFYPSSIPEVGDIIEVTYISTDDSLKAFTYGTFTGDIGPSSVRMGYGVEASGNYSHATGYYTIASGLYQTAIGRYNVADDNSHYALMIGNGLDASSRSNALAVDWNGIIYARNPANTYANIFDLIYPVGSIYMSVNSTSPATLFGGTWQRISGKFLLAATDGGATGTSVNSRADAAPGASGGEASHTLDEGELPSISGYFDIRRWGTTPGNAISNASGKFASSIVTGSGNSIGTAGSATGSQRLTYSFGSGNSHNNMPPFLAVYVWKRTA